MSDYWPTQVGEEIEIVKVIRGKVATIDRDGFSIADAGAAGGSLYFSRETRFECLVQRHITWIVPPMPQPRLGDVVDCDGRILFRQLSDTARVEACRTKSGALALQAAVNDAWNRGAARYLVRGGRPCGGDS